MAKAGSKDCFIHPGYSTFQRNVLTAPAAGSKAVLTFATAFCQGADLSGQAALTFDSATSGNIRFKRFPASVAGSTGLTFTNYSETYKRGARELVVKFDITGVFPVTAGHRCALSSRHCQPRSRADFRAEFGRVAQSLGTAEPDRGATAISLPPARRGRAMSQTSLAFGATGTSSPTRLARAEFPWFPAPGRPAALCSPPVERSGSVRPGRSASQAYRAARNRPTLQRRISSSAAPGRNIAPVASCMMKKRAPTPSIE